MPLIQVKLIEGVFDAAEKEAIIEKLTDAMVSVEGEAMRPVTWVTIEEVASGEWACAPLRSSRVHHGFPAADGGAPRRNRTGDPILAMEPPGTAVRNGLSPGHARPLGPELCALLACSYAFSDSDPYPGLPRCSRNQSRAAPLAASKALT
jgi:4-oxalocrotonate tautomerase